MKRAELMSKLSAIIAKLDMLKSQREENPIAYVTRDKFLPGHGYIHEISSIPDLTSVTKYLLDKSNIPDIINAVTALGLTDEEVELCKGSPITILGYSPNVWKADVHNRLAEIRRSTMIEVLTNAKKALKKHMNEDDKFIADTAFIANIDLTIDAQ